MKSIKLKNDNYFDSSAIMHNRKNLKTEIENLKQVVLYNNSSGTNGNLTLSESCENFSYIEVFYQYGGTETFTNYDSTKIFSPNNKQINLSIVLAGSGGTNIQFKTSVYKISGKNMTLSNWYGDGTVNNNAATGVSKIAVIRIVRVIGYK